VKILVSHVDLDGLGPVILETLFHNQLGFDVIMNIDYGWEEDLGMIGELSKYSEVVFADMGVSEMQYDWWKTTEMKVAVFDHHETSKPLIGKPDCVIDMERCGTKIFFEEYVKPRIGRYRPILNEFIDLVDAYDLWKLDNPLWQKALDLNRVMYKYACWNAADFTNKHCRFINSLLRKLENDRVFSFTPTELRYIEESKVKEEDAFLRAKKTLKIRKDHWGRKFGVFLAWGKISITASRLLYEDDGGFDYVVAVQDYRDEFGKLSIRSRRGGDFYCTDLGVFNGHIEASGCTITPEQAKAFYENDSLCFKYKREMKDENDLFHRMENIA
jgi:oligoribonuclease NrnB/cAMP/cGMP phosphodiesterase (DHH superfamily)